MFFTINKNKHYSNNWLYKLIHFFNFKKQQSFIVKFDESCLYEWNDGSVNKLFGFSFGFHHQNSIRFGWMPFGKQIKIYTYLYVNGIRDIREIGEVEINEECYFTINKLYISLKTPSQLKILGTTQNQIKKKYKISYNLWPYFGGKNIAPHNIKIEFKKYEKQ